METELTRTAHPAVHLAVGAWHARRSRRLVASVEALLPDVAAAVEHVTGQALPLTIVHINSLAVAAMTIETGAHRSHLGPQPRNLVLKHVVRSWLGLFLNQARTVRYDHPTVQVFLNPVLLRHADDEELVRVIGHELVHGVQLVHPASTGYGADLANNYRLVRYTPLQAAEANAVVALHEAAAYRLEDQIVEVAGWHRDGLIGDATFWADMPNDPVHPVTDLIERIDGHTSGLTRDQPLRMLEELRESAPVDHIAELVRVLADALRAEGRTLIADGLDEASRQLRSASELLLESVDPDDEMAWYLQAICGEDLEEYTFKPGDVDDIADVDPVSLTPALATLQAGAR